MNIQHLSHWKNLYIVSIEGMSVGQENQTAAR